MVPPPTSRRATQRRGRSASRRVGAGRGGAELAPSLPPRSVGAAAPTAASRSSDGGGCGRPLAGAGGCSRAREGWAGLGWAGLPLPLSAAGEGQALSQNSSGAARTSASPRATGTEYQLAKPSDGNRWELPLGSLARPGGLMRKFFWVVYQIQVLIICQSLLTHQNFTNFTEIINNRRGT
ncbi:uncharacterized protein ACIBXB_019795 [Morphnus guianensis]